MGNLAEIDTIVVSLVDLILWRPDLLKATKAKRLLIECELDPTIYKALLMYLEFGAQRTFTVDTIECLVKADGDYPDPQPRSFENDAEVWEEIQDWFTSTINNYR